MPTKAEYATGVSITNLKYFKQDRLFPCAVA